MRTISFRKDIAIILTIAWMAIIFYLSHQPAETSSELSGTLLQLLLTVTSIMPFSFDFDFVHFLIRKSAHFIAYFILGFLVFHTTRLFIKRNLLTVIIAFIISILYAISDEYHQTFIPGRSGEVRDVLLDSFGSFTGIIVYITIFYLMKRQRMK